MQELLWTYEVQILWNVEWSDKIKHAQTDWQWIWVPRQWKPSVLCPPSEEPILVRYLKVCGCAVNQAYACNMKKHVKMLVDSVNRALALNSKGPLLASCAFYFSSIR